MRTNQAGIELIKSFEGLRLEAYKDPGVGIWTIGYGHTSAAGHPAVTPGMKITEFDAENILARDLAVFETAVENAVTVPLNGNQFSALTSFCYNVGSGAFRSSSVLKAVNEGRFDDVPARLSLWNKATVDGKKVELRGLTRRRKAEGALFMLDAMSVMVPRQPDDPGPVGYPPYDPDLDMRQPSRSPWGWLVGALIGAGAVLASKAAGWW